MLFLLFVVVGALAGTLSGLFGIGGGAVVVPMLVTIYQYLGFPDQMIMQFAAGTSMAVMIVTTSASARAHAKQGQKIWPVFKKIIPGLALGVVTGALIADSLHSEVLEVIFGLMLFFIAYKVVSAPKEEAEERIPNTYLMAVITFALGTLSGTLGISGSILLTPFLLHCNVSIRLIVAVAAACGVCVATIGTITYMITGANEIHSLHWTTGYIYWPAFLGIALASPIFATLGAKLSHRLPVNTLRKIFAIFMVLAAIKMIIGVFD